LQLVQRQRERSLDQTSELEPPLGRVHVRNVEVDQQVVEAERRELVAQRLERHAVVPGGELQLLS